MKRIVLAYSGGLDTSVAIPWLSGTYGAEVVTVTLDLGQGQALEAVRDRALAAGAVRAHVLDVRDEFARDHVLKALKADATPDDHDAMSTALGVPLIARQLVEIAAIEQTGVVAHCGTGESRAVGRGDGQAGLDLIPRALNPAISVLAVAREWGMTRPEALEYARTRGLPVPAAADGPYDIGANLWGRSIKSRGLDNPWIDPPEDTYTLTKAPEECPAEAAYVEITFERGVPTAINGVLMPLVELIASLGTIAGAHGVGRGIFYEAPAAVVLHTAHRELQRMVTAREAGRFSRVVSGEYTDVVCNGLWFTPLHEALDAYVEKIQERVTGVVRLKLFKGDCRVAGRKSPFAMSQLTLPGADAALDPGPAVDLLKIVGLSSRTAARQPAADGPQSPLPTAATADYRLPTDD